METRFLAQYSTKCTVQWFSGTWAVQASKTNAQLSLLLPWGLSRLAKEEKPWSCDVPKWLRWVGSQLPVGIWGSGGLENCTGAEPAVSKNLTMFQNNPKDLYRKTETHSAQHRGRSTRHSEEGNKRKALQRSRRRSAAEEQHTANLGDILRCSRRQETRGQQHPGPARWLSG